MTPWLVIPLSIFCLFALAALALVLPTALIKSAQKSRLRAACAGKLVLSYDDGPGSLLTPPLLALLAAHQARASFYLVGFRAQRFPDACRLIASAGHDLGCHTHWHTNALRTLPWVAAHDVSLGYQTLTPWLPPNAAFRPPFGKLNLFSWLITRRLRVPIAWWTADSGDTWPTLPDPARIVDQILPRTTSASSAFASAPGAVVLMHSHDRGDDRHQFVLRITELLLLRARELNISVCTMADILSSHSAPQPAHAS